MADVTIKRIDQLPAASTPQGTDLLPLWQGNQTTKVPLSNIQASGPAGKDGVSPTVEVSKSGTQTTITITDAQGKHTATINDGAPGKDGTPGTPGKDGGKGDPGEDGFSPTVSINKVGKTTTITITDKTGPHVATIEDGADGEGGGGSAYTLPVASAETLGGVKAKAKTDAETVEVAVDKDGKLYVPATSSGGGGGEGYTLPVASADAIGGVKGPEKTEAETEQVHIDNQGQMWVMPSGGGSGPDPLTMTLNVEIVNGTKATVTVTAQSIHRALRVGDVIETTLTLTDNEYVITDDDDPMFGGNLFFDKAYGEVRAVSEQKEGKTDVVIVFTTFSTSAFSNYSSADVTSLMFNQDVKSFTLEIVASKLFSSEGYLLTPQIVDLMVEGTLPSSGTEVRMYYTRDDVGRITWKTLDGTEAMKTSPSDKALSVLALPFADSLRMMRGGAVVVCRSGMIHVLSSGTGGGGGGVNLYIEDVGNNPALGNVDFGKYKAGDVVLVVKDMVVSKT